VVNGEEKRLCLTTRLAFASELFKDRFAQLRIAGNAKFICSLPPFWRPDRKRVFGVSISSPAEAALLIGNMVRFDTYAIARSASMSPFCMCRIIELKFLDRLSLTAFFANSGCHINPCGGLIHSQRITLTRTEAARA
jgi:hypothetical protein